MKIRVENKSNQTIQKILKMPWRATLYVFTLKLRTYRIAEEISKSTCYLNQTYLLVLVPHLPLDLVISWFECGEVI